MRPLAEALEKMRVAYPRQPFGDVAIRVFAEQLADLDGDEVLAAVNRLLKVSTYMPTIAEIRREVMEERLGLPTVEEAWDMAVEGNSEGIEEVAAALKAVGGPWVVKHGDRPETTRAQFRQQYEARRSRSIREAALGEPITAQQLKAARVTSLNERRLRELPETTRIRPRPITQRLMYRYAGRIVPAPTEADMQDAIAILREGPLVEDDPTYLEAERIHHEATVAMREDR